MAFEKPGGGGFSATYLKTVNNQLCALFNHAVRFYGLSSNPCRRAESMGSKSAGEDEPLDVEREDALIFGMSRR